MVRTPSMAATSPQPRLYDTFLREHFARNRQMAFVSGPRQVGKTTTCRLEASECLNWDNADDRGIILRGPAAVSERLGLDRIRSEPSIGVVDELHKYAKWRTFLKGFFDTNEAWLSATLAAGRKTRASASPAASRPSPPASWTA